MGTLWHFPVFILASILIFSGVMRFSLFLGWGEYLPFVPIPPLWR